jgi:hypothetical protein
MSAAYIFPPLPLLLPVKSPDGGKFRLNFREINFHSLARAVSQATFIVLHRAEFRRRLSHATHIHATLHYDIHLNLRKL